MASRSQKREKRTVTPKSPTSPLSGTLISREAEKSQMINLNDRLAAYIDRVRQLEQENNQLQIRCTTFEESKKDEYVYLKETYQKELDDVRKLLDDTAGEKARSLIEAGKYKSELEDMRPQFTKAQRSLDTLQKKVPRLEEIIRDKDAEVQLLRKENEEIKKKLSTLEDSFDDVKSKLDVEIMKYVDLQNKYQSIQEDLQFKEKLYSEEVEQMNKRVMMTSMSIPADTSQDDLNVSLLDSLIELRDQNEKQKASLPKPDPVQVTDPLIDRINDLEREIIVIREKHHDDNQKYDQKVKDLQNKVNDQMKDYQDLLDLKLSLDDEIMTYRKLLDQFENKLDTASPVSQKQKPAQENSAPSRKRPRVGDDADEQPEKAEVSDGICRFM